jgi:ABC-type amino acid transport substrate-binding protein
MSAKKLCLSLFFAYVVLGLTGQGLMARDLADIRQDGIIRHLGVPYAQFISGDGHGLDIDLIKLFAQELGLQYEYVETNWKNVIPDLIGAKIKVTGDNVELLETVPLRGDVIANGLTVLPWRQKILTFSAPTFPTQVWLVTGAQSPLQPIKPSGSLQRDITMVKALLAGKTVLGMEGTCLDLTLYNLDEVRAIGRNFQGNLNELAPAVLNNKSDTTLLDVPDTLVAMAKWPGQVKVLGPISARQEMAVGFRNKSPELQKAFAAFFEKIWENGTYATMVKKYYPDVIYYYPDFFGTGKISASR